MDAMEPPPADGASEDRAEDARREAQLAEERSEDEREERLAEEEAAAAGAEAAEIGGGAPPDSEDPAEEPLLEAGEGEAEGFELAERDLEDIASHGDQHRFPDQVPPPPEEPEGAEHGEGDEAIPPDGSE